MLDPNSHITRLFRRAMMMLGLGKITGITSDEGVAQTLQYKTDMEVRANTPRMAEFGFSSGLPAGTDVLIAFLAGDRSNPVIIASNNQSYRHTGLKEGESVMYNQWGMFIRFTESGIDIEARGQPVTINNASTATVNATENVTLNTPNLYVTGDITDNSESNSATLKQLRDAYNEHDHVVEKVETGNASITSRSPEDTV